MIMAGNFAIGFVIAFRHSEPVTRTSTPASDWDINNNVAAIETSIEIIEITNNPISNPTDVINVTASGADCCWRNVRTIANMIGTVVKHPNTLDT